MNSALRNLRGARRFSTTVIRMGTDKEKGIWRQESTPRQGQMGARNLFRSSGPLSTSRRNEFRAPKKSESRTGDPFSREQEETEQTEAGLESSVLGGAQHRLTIW